jgi:hypothetical protein
LIEIGQLEKKIFKNLQCIFTLFLLSPLGKGLEKGVALHMNNSESPSPKDDLCQLWPQLAQLF